MDPGELPNGVQGNKDEIHILPSNNVGISDGDSLATWRLESGLAIELLKTHKNIKTVVCVLHLGT